jgi:hypothetical protein
MLSHEEETLPGPRQEVHQAGSEEMEDRRTLQQVRVPQGMGCGRNLTVCISLQHSNRITVGSRVSARRTGGSFPNPWGHLACWNSLHRWCRYSGEMSALPLKGQKGGS